MAEITEKIVFEGDASQLQNAFEALVNQITRTREELKEYKNDKEKTAELTKKLADQEMALVKVMQQNDNVIDASNVSYRQLNDILKDLNKTYKQTSDEASRVNLAPSIKAINTELKGMDASIGNFQRNVGNYEGAIDKASKNLAQSFRQIGQTLPSLIDAPEKFFMALAQSIPNLVEAYRSIGDAQKAAAAATAKQVELDKMEMANKDALAAKQTALNTAKAASASASAGETDAEIKLKNAEIEETKVTLESQMADFARINTARASIAANLTEAESVLDLMKAETLRSGKSISDNKEIQEQYRKVLYLREQLDYLDKQREAAAKVYLATEERINKLYAERAALEGKVAASTTALAGAETAAGAGAETMAAGEEVATVATKGLGAALSSFLLIATVVVSIIAIFGKDILKWAKNLGIFNSEARKAARFQKEWNQYMKEGHQNAAKQIVDLQIYSRWATMASKSDKERTIAAKEVLKTMGSATTATNIAKVKNGEFAQSIDEVTKALIKQAQAEAMTSKITEKYKEVIEAMDKVADARNGKIDALGSFQQTMGTVYSPTIGVGGMPTPEQTQKAMDDALQGSIKRAEENLKGVQNEFEQWLNKFLEEFNPSELLFGKNGGSGGDKGWFSKWELYIKEFEATLQKYQGEYEELDFASIWKYSAEGLKYYNKMYDEYIEHYKNDEKALREAQVNKQKYLNEFNEYHTKLQKQYLDSLKTELKVELDQLEEWYTVQKEIYKNAGEDTTGLEAEYTKRKEAILDKYTDKYKNALLERKALDLAVTSSITEYNKAMMEVELANLDDTFKKELKEYERKGIETTKLVEHYAQESEKIHSKYAKQEADAVIAQIQREEEALKRRNNADTGRSMLLGNDASVKGERVWGAMGSTSVWGIERNKAEVRGLEGEKKIFEDSANAQIAEMQRVLDSGKLIGEERLQMEAALAEAQKELELGVLEYQLQIDQLRVDNAKAAFDEISGYLQQGFQGLGGIFDDVYTSVEKTMELKVKEGKMSNEEAEKQLEEYKGIKAAAATMDALGSAVGAYNSLASIPYVGPALGIAAAAAALAAGMANVKLILATTKDNAGSGTDTYANAMPSLSDYQPQYVTNITGKDDTDYLANALNEKPIQAYVVESDVTAAQEVATKRSNETTW